ncbi:hypothetical protein ACLOJK_033422 [Asimina triloba]
MRKTRGFRLRIVKLWRWAVRKPTSAGCGGYLRLTSPAPDCKNSKTMTKIRSWGRCLTRALCFSRKLPPSGYARVGHTPQDEKALQVPKGHLAVYVGQKDNDTHRYLVPVIYCNHPLFGQLLREAEEEFGFQHPGGIVIPCPASEFEKVRTRIAAGQSCRKLTFWRP